MTSILRSFIVWAARRSARQRVEAFAGDFLFWRYQFLWPNEFIDGSGRHWWRPPWWRPFNVFLHQWGARVPEEMHDHPRWSITIVLRGRLIEKTPWTDRVLRPGSVVIRSRKAIHAFRVPPEYRCRTWTLFIVGRRNHLQHTYTIRSQRGVEGQVV